MAAQRGQAPHPLTPARQLPYECGVGVAAWVDRGVGLTPNCPGGVAAWPGAVAAWPGAVAAWPGAVAA
jgi:hypothetical protein